jgi:hypothetical protein
MQDLTLVALGLQAAKIVVDSNPSKFPRGLEKPYVLAGVMENGTRFRLVDHYVDFNSRINCIDTTMRKLGSRKIANKLIGGPVNANKVLRDNYEAKIQSFLDSFDTESSHRKGVLAIGLAIQKRNGRGDLSPMIVDRQLGEEMGSQFQYAMYELCTA